MADIKKKFDDEDGQPVGECPVTKRIRPLGGAEGICFEAYWDACHKAGVTDPMDAHAAWKKGAALPKPLAAPEA